jgi:hypothetical protein
MLAPLPLNIRSEVWETVREISKKLLTDFEEMCRTGALIVVARPNSPLEKFSVVTPDVFAHFQVED